VYVRCLHAGRFVTLDAAPKAATDPPSPRRKDDRLWLRLSAQERALISEAAAVADTTVTEFVLPSTADAAHQVLADPSLPESAHVRPAGPCMGGLRGLLDREPRSLPRLVELLGEPSVLQ